MTSDVNHTVYRVNENTAPSELSEELEAHPEAFFLVIDTNGLTRVLLPEGIAPNRFVIVESDLFLLLPDGQVIALIGGADNSYVIEFEGYPVPASEIQNGVRAIGPWNTLSDIPVVALSELLSFGTARPGSGEQKPVEVGDPLIGLSYNPLLPFTDYQRPERREREYDGAGSPGPGINSIVLASAPVTRETDSPLAIRPSDYLRFDLSQADLGEAVTRVNLTISGLPLGTTATTGQIVAASGIAELQFTGTEEEFDALFVTFPTDFSTESRNDFSTGPMQASVSFDTNYLGRAQLDFPIVVRAEGDAEIDDTLPDSVPDETDDPITFLPSDLLEPIVTDIDGSESLESLELIVTGLPDGATLTSLGVVIPPGATADLNSVLNGSMTLIITMNADQVADIPAAYDALSITVPADFSTANRPDLLAGTALPIGLTLNIQTDEDISALIDGPNDGTVSKTRIVDIGFEEDIDLTGPALIDVEEDGGIPNVSIGVDVPLNLDIIIDDRDGSETEDPSVPLFAGRVEIVFDSIPAGTTVNGGRLIGNVWTGNVPQAEALIVSLPGNYAGSITAVTTVTTREGSETLNQTIVVTPTSDVEIIGDITSRETDSPLQVILSDFVDVIISDPNEALTTLDFILPGLPTGTRLEDGFGNVLDPGTPEPGGTVAIALSYDATTDTYPLSDVRLIFPVDYSSVSPPTTLQANVTVQTTQGGIVNPPVMATIPVTIEAEGDVWINDALPDTIPDETDSATLVVPSQLLLPEITDIDGSESYESLVLTVTGLPAGSTLASLGITVPTGASATIVPDPITNASMLTLTMASAGVPDILAAYTAFTLTLPADFSTANRADLINGDTALPLTFRLDVQTDEDQDPATDTPTDGTATATRIVEIDFEQDIDLNAPLQVIEQEDGGIPESSVGVDVDLQIDIAITDSDGSETADPSDPRFAAGVTITYSGLPAGTTVNGGTLAGEIWTGTVAEANTLVLSMPGDYNGNILSIITVTTPEGTSSTPQFIVIEPTTDVSIGGEVISQETDAPLDILLSNFIDVQIPPDETVRSLDFSVANLPTGTLAQDASGNPVGAFTDNGNGTSDFIFNYTGTGTNPRDVRLIFPTDYSTVNPPVLLFGDLTVTTDSGTTSGTIPITIEVEGDVSVNSATLDIAETDDVVLIRPADQITPTPTDADGSESITQVAVVFEFLPTGARFSIDGGATFNLATSTLDFLGDLATYNQLVIELPADFSTENPATTLRAQIVATTDENGLDTGVLTLNLATEGDVELSGPGVLFFGENDRPGDTDEDNTTSDPVDARLADAITGNASDADGSESIVSVDVMVNGLPDGTWYSVNAGASFQTIASGPSFGLTGLTLATYENLILRFPDDFSTVMPITGSATFTTDEALLAGEIDSGPDDGIETGTFAITVNSEKDIEITTQDLTVIEDLGVPILLNMDARITDIDGSESITSIMVDFANLPAGDTVLSDGTVLNAGNTQWAGTAPELQALSITSLPIHYSGFFDITVTVTSDEGDPAGEIETFRLNVTPVAEPTIVLSVDDSTTNVDEVGPDNFIVDEDTSFLLLINAQTPDQDGSETLSQVVIENVPPGWVSDTGGTVDPALFEQGAAQIASAVLSGTTLTISLVSGVTSFDAALRVVPLSNDDRDVLTIVGDDLETTVTSVDVAPGQPTDTKVEIDTVDVDVDAIVDPLSFTPAGTSVNENQNNIRRIDVDLAGLTLTDTDGSETITDLDLTITVATASDVFDPSDPGDLDLRISDSALAGFVVISQTGSSTDSVSYNLSPAGGATDAQFAAALESLQTVVPQHFSGILTLDGTLAWNETQTGDFENDLSDNFGNDTFQIVQTVRPRAEADLNASVFVLSGSEVAIGSATSVSASVEDGSVSGSDILTLLESTDDGSGPGQVDLFVGLDGSTPDTDGSEELRAIVIENIPSDWVRDILNGTLIDDAEFFLPDGSAPLGTAELSKIDSANYDSTTGTLTISFVSDVTSFAASLKLKPTLYEDYDVDRQTSDPFSSAGDFFGQDLQISLTTRDDNSATTDDQVSDATFDVDVDPVNNIAAIINLPTGNEAIIDAAGGVWQIPFTPVIQDTDGSETITAVVLREIPSGVTVYVPDPGNPGGPKIPALLTEVNQPTGFNSWSLESDQWLGAELRGIPLHFAGDYPIVFEVVTTEADGGGTRITRLSEVLRIDPVVDGGDPSEGEATDEDQAVQVVISGNLIDNSGNSPGSPEAILDDVIITNVVADSAGRLPRFFEGDPGPLPPGAPRQANEFIVALDGSLVLSAAQAANLWVLPGRDSNEDVVFDVTVVYFETLDPTERSIGTGTVRVDVRGIADDPIVEAQDAASFADPDDIASVWRPDEVIDGVENSDRIYGYAGFDTAPFELASRLRDGIIDSGLIISNPITMFTSVGVDPLSGSMTEILVPESAPTGFDGSETLYFLITGVDPSTAFAGASPVDGTGESYLVTEAQLGAIQFVPTDVSEPTYYDMQLTALVVEDDQTIPSLTGLTPEQAIAAIDALPGGATETVDFTVVVVPDPDGGGGNPCTPEQDLPLPTLELVGSGDEDTEIAFKIKITPQPPFYDSIDDLANLPNGVTGSFGLGISIPPGSMLSSSPSGAVLYDPVTGLYVIDFAALGVDPSDPTQTQGSLLFTPPAHDSSPVNPFPVNETFGPDDPYDNLNQLDFEMILNNFTCGTSDSGSGSFAITINPVVDGPDIILGGGSSFDEDTVYDLNLQINGIDGGERPTGNIVIEVDGANGGQLLDSGGTAIAGTPIAGGFTRYTLSPSQITGLGLTATEHYSGPLEIRVTASSEDIDGSILANTVTRVLDVIPVADVPEFDFDTTVTDPETGLPFVDTSGPVPVITAIEDIPFLLGSVLDADSPDQDGSEAVSIVLGGVPDYLDVTGPAGSGFVDNGDGTYTISRNAWPQVAVKLKDDHARLPDSLDPTLPTEIPLTVKVNTLELANSDETSGTQDIILRVRPDADVPTVSAEILPATGTEDDGSIYVLAIVGTTPDAHESLAFRISVPVGGRIFLDGVEQPAVGGVVELPGTAGATTGAGNPVSFQPAGTVTFDPPADFAGDISLQVVSVTTDADGIFTDTESSVPANLDLTITPTPDLVLTVLDPDVDLIETDAVVSHSPAAEFDIQVTDTDGSEFVDNVIFSVTGVPDGTSYQIGTGASVPVTGDLVFSGSLADFTQLQVNFPRDFATNGTPLDGTIQVTTNEGGDENGAFTIAIDGELDLTVTVLPTPTAVPQTGNPITIDFGINATVTDIQAMPSETLEEVVVQFTAPVPVGTTTSAGTFSADRQTLTLTRGSSSPADFALLVAALSITLPGTFAGTAEGAISVSTNHGTAPAEAFSVAVNDQPVVTNPVDVMSFDTVFFIDNTSLLANASDPDGPLGVENLATADPDVALLVQATGVQVTVPDGYVGTPVLTYDVVDSGPGPARTSTQANLDIDTLQMEATGTSITDPGGAPRDLLDDVTGAPGGNDIAKGTSGNDGVVLSATSPYAEIEGFDLLGGDDFIDLSGSAAGFSVGLGSGDDWAIGSSGNDRLVGGGGQDTLEGGLGADIFVMSDLTLSDVITDYDTPGSDQIDLLALVTLNSGEVLADQVTYSSGTGDLTVQGSVAANISSSAGGVAAQVEVIFNDASGAQQTAII